MPEPEKVLIAGFAARHVVQSAYNAGYRVKAVDSFCDTDMAAMTESCTIFSELEELPGVIESELKKDNFGIIAVTSGAEALELSAKICGTDPKTAAYFLNKKNIQDFFEKHNIPCPPLADEGEYPVMLKPCCGAGGWRNKKVYSKEEEDEWRVLMEDMPYIRQRLVSGTPCSVSCVSDGKRAVAVSFNEQIMRGGDGDRAYGFAGAVVPFTHPLEKEITACAEKIVALSGCVGSIGVDFMADENSFYAIEVNPRFQGTLDVVEKATGISIFSAHVNAARGILPPAYTGKYKCFAARRVIFTDTDITAADDLSKVPELKGKIADIPRVSTKIEAGGAVVSAYGTGKTRAEALESLDKTINDITRYIERWQMQMC